MEKQYTLDKFESLQVKVNFDGTTDPCRFVVAHDNKSTTYLTAETLTHHYVKINPLTDRVKVVDVPTDLAHVDAERFKAVTLRKWYTHLTADIALWDKRLDDIKTAVDDLQVSTCKTEEEETRRASILDKYKLLRSRVKTAYGLIDKYLADSIGDITSNIFIDRFVKHYYGIYTELDSPEYKALKTDIMATREKVGENCDCKAHDLRSLRSSLDNFAGSLWTTDLHAGLTEYHLHVNNNQTVAFYRMYQTGAATYAEDSHIVSLVIDVTVDRLLNQDK